MRGLNSLNLKSDVSLTLSRVPYWVDIQLLICGDHFGRNSCWFEVVEGGVG